MSAPSSPSSPSPSSITFAELLRHHRTAAGLTQEELAARAGLSVDAISTLERGARRRPRQDTVTLLATALALSEEERAALLAARRSPAATLPATPAPFVLPGVVATAPADADALPHGVVTFLLADIEGSTQLLHQLGARYAEALAEVAALLRGVWAAHAGHELGASGDHFAAVFAFAEDALAAAAAAQQALAARVWPDGARVWVRMGLHSGAALLTAGRYVGPEVQRAARIATAGHGGQVIVSGAVAEQVAKFGYALPDGASLRSLGAHRLAELPHREPLYQLALPDLPGLPTTYPPLRTLDAWPGLRADLTAVVLMSVALLAVVGPLLALLAPPFPWAVGLGAAALVGAALLGVALARPLRRTLVDHWRSARKPFAGVISGLLSLVVVTTTLFITKPPVIIKPAHPGYDFTYTYHAPTHRGGAVTIEFWGAIQGFMPYMPYGVLGTTQAFMGLWQTCLTQLPDTSLGLASYKPDQCVEVPTVANLGEDPDGKWTIFHIDPRAAWSDGTPITAADYVFADHLAEDPSITGGGPPFEQHTLTALDSQTVRIDWTAQFGFGDYLAVLARLQPIPLHIYAIGKFAGVYDPTTGVYNSALAQQLVASPGYLTQRPLVDDGPFTVQSFVPNKRAVLMRNPRFFSNFFHAPAALDSVTLITINPTGTMPRDPLASTLNATLVADFRHGGVDLVDGMTSLAINQLSNIPQSEVVTSPVPIWLELGFNQRAAAPNAQANGGVSLFRDKNVRKAFVEAFDRCAAVRAQVGAVNCSDPNLFTNEATTPPAPDYDPSVKLPAYNPTAAAKLMDDAGYPVVDGVRRAKDGKTPLRIAIVTSFGGARAPLLARRLQQDYMRNLKMSVTLDLSGDLLNTDIDTKGTFDIAFWAQAGAPDPVYNGWDTFLDFTDAADIPPAGSGANDLGIIDRAVIQQVQLGSRTPDAGQSANVYRELQRYVAQQFYVEPVLIEANVELVKPTLCNFKPSPQFLGNLWSMPDWYLARGSTCPG